MAKRKALVINVRVTAMGTVEYWKYFPFYIKPVISNTKAWA